MSEYMIFCLGDGRLESKGPGFQKNNMVFNKQVTHDEWMEIRDRLSFIKIPLTKWIKEEDMTKAEKKEKNIYKEIGGYLKVLSYKDAWAQWWKDASKDDKAKITTLKQFDADIFEGITGIKVDAENTRKQELLKKA